MPLQPQPYGRSQIGIDPVNSAFISTGGTTTFAMAGLNACYAARFVYEGTSGRDIKSIKASWSAVSAPGTVRVRVETIDLTTGKPTGTLYDANATIDITPTTGVQTITFATTPTTNLVPGTAYAILFITTVAGTTQTLRVYSTSNASYPARGLTAADGTTRSNLAEVASSTPTLSVVFDDNSEDTLGFLPATAATVRSMTGTLGVGQKFTLTSDIKVAGVVVDPASRGGTVTGDFRVRIFDGSGNVVANTTVTLDKDLLTASNQRTFFWFPAVVTLAAASGPYRVLFDQSDHGGTGGNCFTLNTIPYFSAALVPTGFNAITTVDATAVPPVFVDVTTDVAAIGLLLADGVASVGTVAYFPVMRNYIEEIEV